ncbi:cation-transporting atpase 4 protein [Diplodia corticola]|uniref:Cation-transporting atpase 4 protein n=1 Tax=Diplodia corticola TaxID=236234 RepID=A0A1J9QJF1_9PEZI|nr:cation-transporting atpase 4 protein [Diplodia corticola]OJD28990.1 cation-transporting atpase 4 protein [Diplodia corticola]
MASISASLTPVPTPSGQGLLELIIILLALTWVTVIARTATRYKINALGLDDWLMIIGLICFSVTCTLVILSICHGAGARAAQLSAYDNMMGRKLIYCLTTIPIKCSICVSLLRIATKPTYKWILYGVMGFTVTSSIIFEVVILTYCRPFAVSWGGAKGTCGAPTTNASIGYFYSAECILTDWTLAVLPVFMLHDVQLKRRVKVSVSVILAMGAFASTATIVRLRYLVLYNDPTEFLFGVAPIAVWSLVEEGVGIVAGSLAALRPLFKYIPFLRSSTAGSSSGDGVGASSSGRMALQSRDSSRGAHRKGSVKMQSVVSGSAAYDPEHAVGRGAYGDIDSESNILKETDVVVVTSDLEGGGERGRTASFSRQHY